MKDAENREAFASVVSIEFDCLQKSRRLFIQDGIPDRFAVAAKVDGVQHSEGTANAKHAADTVPQQDVPQRALHRWLDYIPAVACELAIAAHPNRDILKNVPPVS
jgi:hypothetical protein